MSGLFTNEHRIAALACADLIQGLYDGKLQPSVVCKGSDTQVHIFRGPGMVNIMFPGTDGAQDWITDLRIAKWPWIAGMVHAGFRAATYSVWAQIQDALPEQHQLRPIESIVIAGHSLGGALAMLCAHLIAKEMPGLNIQAVYTFGQPRVGNWSFTRDYNAKLHDQTFRIVNARDPIPHVPFVFGTYKHCGTEVFLNREGGVTVAKPMWTAVLETKQTIECGVRSAECGTTNQFVSASEHYLKAYIAKLEALDA
jgi:hypothetical protein